MSYNANASLYKQKIREMILKTVDKTVKDHSTLHSFLSLSNTSFYLEEMLLNLYPKSQMDCFEMDKSVFERALNVVPNGIKLNFDNIFNADKSKPYSFIWLDFCNSYTDRLINQTIEFVSSVKFDKEAVLAITLNKKRGQASDKLSYAKYYPNYKDKGFAEHISHFINGKVESIKRMEYVCKDICPHGASMNLFIFKIKNHETSRT